MADRFHDVPGARLTLRSDHRRALADPAERLAEIAAAAHERDLEHVLVDVVPLVRGGEDFALVDEVDAQRLEHPRLDEVADPRLGHHGDRDDLHDLLDLEGIGHPGHAALRPDIGGHALQRHHRAGAGIFGDLRLLGGRQVHDDAALQHLCHTSLELYRSDVRHVYASRGSNFLNTQPRPDPAPGRSPEGPR